MVFAGKPFDDLMRAHRADDFARMATFQAITLQGIFCRKTVFVRNCHQLSLRSHGFREHARQRISGDLGSPLE